MSLSPYQIIQSINNEFIFVTESGYTYKVYFDCRSNVFADPNVDKYAVYFGFSCNPPLKVLERNFDQRVGVTIMLIISNFLIRNPDAILAYVCSDLDGQDRNRHVLFGKWYNQSSLKKNFNLLRRMIGDIYCGVIYNKNYPKHDVIEESFSDFDFEKPEFFEEPNEPYNFDDEWDDPSI